MGLKSGSRDAGLDESEDPTDERPSDREASGSSDMHEAGEDDEKSESKPPETEPQKTSDRAVDSESTTQRPSMSSIPYKLRRDKVNEGREQVPYFLREEIIDAEDELQDALEAMLGEDVYKSDYREAAMVVAQQNPELVAEILREWGYDLDAP